MMAENKNTGNNNIRYGGGATVVKGLKSHANDPAVLRMAEKAKIAVSKLVLPGSKEK